MLSALLAAPPCRATAQSSQADSLLNQPAPVFARADLDGRSIDLSAYRGRVVLLTFWATWCAPCRIEMPRFARWQSELGAQGLQIIAVSMDDDPAPVRRMVRRRPVNFPVVMGDERLGTMYGGVLGLPVTFLIDRDGNVAARFKGEGNLRGLRAQMLRLIRVP